MLDSPSLPSKPRRLEKLILWLLSEMGVWDDDE